MKLASNLMVAVNSLGAAEAFLLAVRLGIDPQLYLDTAATNAGNSFMLSFLGPAMLRRKFTSRLLKNPGTDRTDLMGRR